MNNIKLKFKVGLGNSVLEYKKDNATLEEVVKLAKDENVISISVVKQTPAQYLKNKRAWNEKLGLGEFGEQNG